MPDIETVKTLFGRALALADDETREGWLRAQCGDDADLLQEVLSLLRSYGEAAGWSAEAAGASPENAVIPDGRFGPYQAVALLGYGGTSAVYRACRVDGNYQQSVALKVMAALPNSGEFVRRFETERQLLASLNHPNIAHLLDGGTSSAGHLYLAMEYIQGERLDQYCDRNKLTIDGRIRLFLQVCEAVDYVHRRLIIHRDLKPNNILVTAEGRVKLLDFGTGALMEPANDATVTRGRMMTPRYASPQRLRGEPASVSDDVFSLGVILYELLTGAWPFGDPKSSLVELKRAMNDSALALPATVITAETAELRSIRARTLKKQLTGDLGAILVKALETVTADRYATVRDFSSDLNCYLLNRPVHARRPTFGYRTGKFLRRNWMAASAATVIAIGLAGATAISMIQARSARDEALKAATVNQFLSGMLSTFAGSDFDGDKYTVMQMLAAADRDLENGPKQPPLIEATLRRSLAESYAGLSHFADAQRQLDRAIPMFRKLGDQRELALALGVEGRVEQSQGNLEGSLRHMEESLLLLGQLGKKAPAAAMFDAELGIVEILSGRGGLDRDPDRARRLLDKAIAIAIQDSSIRRTRLAQAMSDQGEMVAMDGRMQEAKEILQQALAIGRRERPGGSWELSPLYSLQTLSERTGELRSAKEYARQEADVMAQTAGRNNSITAAANVQWARLAARDNQIPEAVTAVDSAMPIIAKNSAPASPTLWIAARDAAVVMRLAGRTADAEAYARQSLRAAQAQNLADSDPRLGNSWEQLGNALAAEKRPAEAIACLQQAQAIYGRAGQNWEASRQAIEKRIADLRSSRAPAGSTGRKR